MLAVAATVGIVIGLSLGALGGGGSILTVPALVYLLGQDPHAATAGSLVIVGITSLAGALAHARAGRVRVGAGLGFGLAAVGGAWAGSRLSAAVPAPVLLAAFSGLLLVVAFVMLARSGAGVGELLRRLVPPVRRPAPLADPSLDREPASGTGGRPHRSTELGATDPGGTDRGGRARSAVGVLDAPILTVRPQLACACRRALLVLATATGVGLLTGFFGVGGGFVVVPALVLVLGASMPVAVGTSLLVISVTSASALAARLGHGVVLDWPVLGAFTVAAVAASLVGARVAGRADPAKLSRAFTVLLVLVAAWTGWQSLAALL